MKVYVVVCGEYSDYHIENVFTDKEKAELYCAIHNDDRKFATDDPYKIEEYDTDNVEVSDKKYYKAARIIYFCYSREILVQEILYSTKHFEKSVFRNTAEYTYTIPFAKDLSEKQLKKMVYDDVAKYLAEKEGI